MTECGFSLLSPSPRLSIHHTIRLLNKSSQYLMYLQCIQMYAHTEDSQGVAIPMHMKQPIQQTTSIVGEIGGLGTPDISPSGCLSLPDASCT